MKYVDTMQDIKFGFINDVADEVAQRAKDSVLEGTGLMFISLVHDGTFPCPVTRMDYVGGTFGPGSTVYLYWMNPSGGLCEEQELTVDENGYVTYTILHTSPYVISGQKVRASDTAPDSPDDPNENGGNNSNPGNITEPGNHPANGGGNDTTIVTNTTEDNRKTGQETMKTAAVKTGDEKNMAPYIWIAVLMGSMAIGNALLLRKRQTRKK
ncbi:hypothetical protein [Christensenella tenuis]|uniref:Uncharacterized protein n=1 Tax=Christensenella tenuis TaxID=2763033 RepID=A0ABR7EK54_9FIRM|nr:hypothetical protein [Christensenella tenuis]MBC5649519.1 hypothetical protein [Christensenella tenuis]